jgi:uncharacterized Zn-binding protein involved in type VI secretion
VGDYNEVGGQILRGAKTVFSNGLPVGISPSPISPHPPYKHNHSVATTLINKSTVFAEFSQVIRVGTVCTCGHTIVQGQGIINVFVP